MTIASYKDFEDMLIGETRTFKCGTADNTRTIDGAIGRAARECGKINNMKFETRRVNGNYNITRVPLPRK